MIRDKLQGVRSPVCGRNEESYRLFRRDLDGLRSLSRDEESALADRIAMGDQEAAWELVEGNMRFIHSVALSYSSWMNIPIMDLINEASLGAYAAALKFERSANCRFITYAVYHMISYIQRHCARTKKQLAFPTHNHIVMKKINNFIGAFSSVHCRKPTIDEIMEETKLSRYLVTMGYMYLSKWAELDRELPAMTKHGRSTVLNALEHHFPEHFSDNEDIIGSCQAREDKEMVRRLISSLSPRHKKIITDIYFNEKSCKDIANELGYSMQLIRHNHAQAIVELEKLARRENYEHQTS